METITNAGRVFRWYNASSYFRQICNTTAGNLVSQQGARIQPSYYLKVLWNLESPVISLLVILSLFFAIKQITSRRKNAQSIFLLTALFILPYLYWVLQRRLHQVEYNCLGSWPFMFLYIGLGVDAIFSNIKVGLFRITAITLFLLVSVSYSLHHLKTLFEIKSHFPEVSRILKEQNITKLIVYKNDGIYSYKDIDPYLIKVDMYTADSLNEVYEIARKEGAGFCFYGSWGYFLAKTKDAVVDGELAAKIKDTAMRPHYPLFLMGLMNSGIANTKAAEEYKDKIYDYMYLYKIKLPKPK